MIGKKGGESNDLCKKPETLRPGFPSKRKDVYQGNGLK
jgi:hypothetical protein